VVLLLTPPLLRDADCCTTPAEVLGRRSEVTAKQSRTKLNKTKQSKVKQMPSSSKEDGAQYIGELKEHSTTNVAQQQCSGR
jgi:hypothetical protein